MTKKKLSVWVFGVLTVCLLSVAFYRVVPASAAAQAANDGQPVLASAAPAKLPAVPAARLAQRPLAAVAGGLVFVLFGLLAVAPLLLGNTTRALSEANPLEI